MLPPLRGLGKKISPYTNQINNAIKPAKPITKKAWRIFETANMCYGKNLYIYHSGLTPLDISLQAQGMKTIISEGTTWFKRVLYLFKKPKNQLTVPSIKETNRLIDKLWPPS